MKNKLNVAEVNCEAHSAICKKAGVTGYPMLTYFGGKGSGNTEYTGGRRLEQLQAFSEKVSGPYVSGFHGPSDDTEVYAEACRNSSLWTWSSGLLIAMSFTSSCTRLPIALSSYVTFCPTALHLLTCHSYRNKCWMPRTSSLDRRRCTRLPRVNSTTASTFQLAQQPFSP